MAVILQYAGVSVGKRTHRVVFQPNIQPLFPKKIESLDPSLNTVFIGPPTIPSPHFFQEEFIQEELAIEMPSSPRGNLQVQPHESIVRGSLREFHRTQKYHGIQIIPLQIPFDQSIFCLPMNGFKKPEIKPRGDIPIEIMKDPVLLSQTGKFLLLFVSPKSRIKGGIFYFPYIGGELKIRERGGIIRKEQGSVPVPEKVFSPSGFKVHPFSRIKPDIKGGLVGAVPGKNR